MRPIKFRGKRVDTGKWVYGSYHKHIDITPGPLVGRIDDIHVHPLIIKDGFSDWNMPRGMEAIKVIPETVGQFTGLYDCEKKEIYEDDIVHCIDMDGEEYVTTVRYDGYAPVIDVNGRDYDYSVIGWAIDVDIEEVQVIGNIHDNPDLLKGKSL